MTEKEGDLVCPFKVLGKLRIEAHDGLFFSDPAMYAIYYLRKGQSKMDTHRLETGKTNPTRVRSLAWLNGKVHIDTPSEALAFVRLGSTPRTYLAHLPDRRKRGVEVLAREDLDLAVFFGDKEDFQYMRKAANGFLGVIDRTKAKELGIPLATARKRLKGFEITRTLVVHRRGDGGGSSDTTLFEVREFVGRNGEYREMGRKPLKSQLANEFTWTFPMRE